VDTLKWVRFVGIPDGEAPLQIRQCWVGVCVPDFGIPSNSSSGLLSGRPRNEPAREKFCVSRAIAVSQLRISAPEAAAYFDRLHPGHHTFVFKQDDIVDHDGAIYPSDETMTLIQEFLSGSK